MGKYIVKTSKSAGNDLAMLKKSGKKADMEKVSRFFEEIEEHPRTGTGKPEQLKYFDGEVWSREIK
jgi:toxin YoeB